MKYDNVWLEYEQEKTALFDELSEHEISEYISKFLHKILWSRRWISVTEPLLVSYLSYYEWRDYTLSVMSFHLGWSIKIYNGQYGILLDRNRELIGTLSTMTADAIHWIDEEFISCATGVHKGYYI